MNRKNREPTVWATRVAASLNRGKQDSMQTRVTVKGPRCQRIKLHLRSRDEPEVFRSEAGKLELRWENILEREEAKGTH